jgi:hypothetical protein
MLPSIAQVLLLNGINSKIEALWYDRSPAYGRQPEGPVELEVNSELGTKEEIMTFYSLLSA